MEADSFHRAMDMAKDRITDPFLLNFLFAMGELSERVVQLTNEMRDFKAISRAELKEANDKIEALQGKVTTLTSRLWLIITGASGVVFLLVKLGDWFIK